MRCASTSHYVSASSLSNQTKSQWCQPIDQFGILAVGEGQNECRQDKAMDDSDIETPSTPFYGRQTTIRNLVKR
jgi:hypothetical protein